MDQSKPLTVEQVLSKLFELRNEYEDTPDSLDYQALHAAFLFLSYQMTAFQQYLDDLQK